MRELGEIEKATDIGYRGSAKHIWIACPDCGKERWAEYKVRTKQPTRLRCASCAAKLAHKRYGSLRGSNHPNWKGGKYKTELGYIRIWLPPDDFFYSMVSRQGYVYEHRLVMAKHLGRCLQPWEIVHHKRGYAKDDNRYPETLQLVMEGQHNQITIIEAKLDKLLEQNRELRQEIRLLRLENKLKNKVF